MPRNVSVIICTYTFDRWNRMIAAVRSAAAQMPPPTEVILVVDHNPELVDRVQRELPGVQVLENTGGRGLSGGRNTGLAAADGEIIAFLDDDAEADPGWLASLVAPYEDERVIATSGKVIAVWETGRPRWLPAEFDWVVGCSYLGLPVHEALIRNPIGCSMSFRREAAVEVGGFRTEVGRVGSLLAGGEETELAIRLARLMPGSRVVYVPSSTVRHHLPASRAQWSYFRSRCYQEGRSKAVLSRFEGARASLSSERAYTMRVLPAGVLRGVRQLLRGDRSGGERAAAIIGGLGITAFGYLRGRFERGGRASQGGATASPGTSRTP